MAAENLVTVARVEDVPPGTGAAVRAGEHAVALYNVDGEFFATQAECLHLKGPLGDGKLEDHVVTCPWHGWQYDVRTGENVFDLAIRLQTFAVVVEDGEVKLAV